MNENTGAMLVKPPLNKEDACKLLHLEADGFFEMSKRTFLKRVGLNNKKAFEQEYKKLQPFFKKLDDYSISTALSSSNDNTEDNIYREYIRIKSGYYCYHNIENSRTKELVRQVIVVFFCFYPWLEGQIKRIDKGQLIYYGYRTKLTIKQLKRLYRLLIDDENMFFAKSIDEQDFINLFNPQEIIVKPLKWIKKTSKNNQTSKMAPLELLNLKKMGKLLEKVFSKLLIFNVSLLLHIRFPFLLEMGGLSM